MATMGKNSPTAPAAMMNPPKRPSSIWLSRRIGSSVPSAVVVRPIAIGTNAWTKPTAAKAPVTPSAVAIVTSQDFSASRPARSRNTSSSARSPPAGRGTRGQRRRPVRCCRGRPTPRPPVRSRSPQDEDHHLRHTPGQEAGQDRRQRREQTDNGEAHQALLKAHWGTPSSATSMEHWPEGRPHPEHTIRRDQPRARRANHSACGG